MQQEWDRLWAEVYSSDIQNLPLMRVGTDEPPGARFPAYVLVGQALICTLSIVVFLTGIFLLLRYCVLATVYTQALSGVLAVWTLVSMKQATLSH